MLMEEETKVFTLGIPSFSTFCRNFQGILITILGFLNVVEDHFKNRSAKIQSGFFPLLATLYFPNTYIPTLLWSSYVYLVPLEHEFEHKPRN